MSDINELRSHLFATLRGLQDTENPMDIDRAKAVADVAQVIINSAKVEVEHVKATGRPGSCFLSAPEQGKPASMQQIKPTVVHKLLG